MWIISETLLIFLSLNISIAYSTKDIFIEITNENFKEIEERRFVVFYFYESSNCSKCVRFYNIMLSEVEDKYSNLEVTFAKINGPQYSAFLFLYQISDLPTLLALRHLNVFSYNFDYSASGFSKFIEETFVSPVPIIRSYEQIDELYHENITSVIGFFEKDHSEEVEVLTTVCLLLDRILCSIIQDKDILELRNITDNNRIQLIKNNVTIETRDIIHYHGNRTSVKDIKEFIQIYELPPFSEYDQFMKERIFDHPIKYHLLFLLNTTLPQYNDIIKEIEIASRSLYGKVILLIIKTNKDPDIDKILKIFELKQIDIPTFVMVLLGDYKEYKYFPTNKTITSDNFISFFEDVEAGKIKYHFKSEPLPTNWNSGNVFILVRVNYKNVTENQNHTVVVNFYSDECVQCKVMEPIWEQVAQHYSNSSDIIISKVNILLNDIENFHVSRTPTIYLYKKSNKSPILYEGRRNVENIIHFIEKEGHSYLTYGEDEVVTEEVSQGLKEEL